MPFQLVQGKHGPEAHAVVRAQNEQELQKEMDDTKFKLFCYTFWCCFLCALQGFTPLKIAREYASKGQDVEARDALLDAKIKGWESCCWGGILCWGIFSGLLTIALLPFIWIPYLIVIA